MCFLERSLQNALAYFTSKLKNGRVSLTSLTLVIYKVQGKNAE